MAAALKLVETEGSDGGGIRLARKLEDRLKWLKQVRESGLVKGNHFLVAHCLFDHCNSDDGRCDPGPSTISAECKIANAKRSLRKLEELGFISSRPSDHSSCNQHNLILRPDNYFQQGSSMTPPGVTDEPPGGSPMNRGGGSPMTPKPVVKPVKEPGIEPGTVPSRDSGVISDDWWPTIDGVAFAHERGMDNSKLAAEVKPARPAASPRRCAKARFR